jgi:hypothetical protein
MNARTLAGRHPSLAIQTPELCYCQAGHPHCERALPQSSQYFLQADVVMLERKSKVVSPPLLHIRGRVKDEIKAQKDFCLVFSFGKKKKPNKKRNFK